MHIVYNKDSGLNKFTLVTEDFDLVRLAESIRKILVDEDKAIDPKDQKEFLRMLSNMGGLEITDQKDLDEFLLDLDNSKNLLEDAKTLASVQFAKSPLQIADE